MTVNPNKVRAAELEVQRAIDILSEARESLSRAQQELVMSEPVESVITFQLRYSGNTKTYNYAALRVGSRWFTTGQTCPPAGYAWRDLLAMINEGELVPGSFKRMVDAAVVVPF